MSSWRSARRRLRSLSLLEPRLVSCLLDSIYLVASYGITLKVSPLPFLFTQDSVNVQAQAGLPSP